MILFKNSFAVRTLYSVDRIGEMASGFMSLEHTDWNTADNIPDCPGRNARDRATHPRRIIAVLYGCELSNCFRCSRSCWRWSSHCGRSSRQVRGPNEEFFNRSRYCRSLAI